jgi:hypothetical protein
MFLKNQDRSGGTPTDGRKAKDLATSERRAVPSLLPRPQQSDRQKRIDLKWAVKQMPERSHCGQDGYNRNERELKPGLEQCLGVVEQD